MQRWMREIGRRLASPTGLAMVYFIFGLTWIFASDRLLARFSGDDATITTLQTYKGWAYVSVTAAMLYGILLTLVARLGAARDRLTETRENFRRLVESSHDGMWVVDREGAVVEVNARLAQILGASRDQLLGAGIARFLNPNDFLGSVSIVPTNASPPESSDPAVRREQQLRAPGANPAPSRPEKAGADSRIVRFRRANDELGWGVVSCVALSDGAGVTTGQLRVLTDITRTKQAEEALRTSLEAERTLLNELDHRVRNNLSSLLTLIELTRRSAAGIEDFAHLISGRVGAMAATHSLLAESKFKSVELTRLISVITEAEQEHRLERDGPPVMLSPAQAGPVAMILQEFWANSVKHGALGAQNGRVIVRWRQIQDAEGRALLRLTWTDKDGPPVRQPDKLGFGLSLVGGLTQSDLRGRIFPDFDPRGATFTIEFPLLPTAHPALRSLAPVGPPPASSAPPPASSLSA